MGLDRLLADFGLDYEGRKRLVARARESFGREFSVGPAVRRWLSKRLRAERGGIEALVTGPPSDDALSLRFASIFQERSDRTLKIVRGFRRLDEGGTLACPLDDLLLSLTHMHANRLFPGSARAHELVIHDFLSRTYHSLVVRNGR